MSSKGEDAVAWIEEHLVDPEGESFQLFEWQEEWLKAWLAPSEAERPGPSDRP